MADKNFEDIKLVFYEYLETYFKERNLEKVKRFFATDFSGFGTGFDEIFSTYEEALRLYKRDMEEAPNTVNYEILHLNIQIPADNTGIVSSRMNIRTKIMSQYLNLNHMRLTMFWTKKENRWLIEHMHLSLPTAAHGQDESFPVKEIEKQNIALERLVKEKTEELKAANDELIRLAVTDNLTGIYNRRHLEESLSIEIERAKRYNRPFSVILLDIDYFKSVNDTYGHTLGDKVLILFAEIISKNIRITDICGRWGGEEFLIICAETDKKGAARLAERIRKLFEKVKYDNIPPKTASLGVTDYREGDTTDTIINRADNALYSAKNNGRNQVVTI
ncbi:MAG: diguanylate cyclase [Deltaproteobacteria bacterium]|nr:diguanylate cyclase [Deltaproteobacteria bacterium]